MKPIPIDTTVKRAIIFGAGRIAEVLMPILACVGFCVWIFDNDPEAAKEERFPQADKILCGDYWRLPDYLELTQDDFLVVLTPHHAFDYDVQLQVLRGDCGGFGYLGVSIFFILMHTDKSNYHALLLLCAGRSQMRDLRQHRIFFGQRRVKYLIGRKAKTAQKQFQ